MDPGLQQTPRIIPSYPPHSFIPTSIPSLPILPFIILPSSDPSHPSQSSSSSSPTVRSNPNQILNLRFRSHLPLQLPIPIQSIPSTPSVSYFSNPPRSTSSLLPFPHHPHHHLGPNQLSYPQTRSFDLPIFLNPISDSSPSRSYHPHPAASPSHHPLLLNR